jgi:hypothetical protein
MRRSALLIALVAAVTCGVTAHPADAALKKSKPVFVKDAAGDATGLGMALPTSQADADILSFKLFRIDNGRKVTGLVGRIDLAAPPTPGHDYYIAMSAEGCSTYNLEVEFPPVTGGVLAAGGYLRHNCEGTDATGSTFEHVVDLAVKGNSIYLTVPVRALPGGVRLGDELKVSGATARLDEGAILFGTLDQAPAPSGTIYTVGQ